MSWLVATYQLTDTVPPCWDRHDALAEELAGFYVAWQNVWADEGRYDAAAVWHEQLHSAAAARWPMWLRGARCSQTCALDTDFAQQTHHRWAEQAAAGGGADHRLTRTRELAPPIPPPTKKAPAKKEGSQKGTTRPGGPPAEIHPRIITDRKDPDMSWLDRIRTDRTDDDDDRRHLERARQEDDRIRERNADGTGRSTRTSAAVTGTPRSAATSSATTGEAGNASNTSQPIRDR